MPPSNSAIDELIPARLRGRIDLIVNGSYWGRGGGSARVDRCCCCPGHLVGIDMGWRLSFGIGAVLGGFILFLRRFVPESPRWQITHGREEEAKQTTAEIERKVGGKLPPPKNTLKVHPRKVFGFGLILGAMVGKNRGRSFLALTLMVAQAFLFNAVFFTYGLVLATFYHIQDTRTGVYLLPLAAGNFLGPLLLGHFFDTVGRKKMIAGTYGVSGLMLVGVAVLFGMDVLTAWTQTFCWMAIFFVASAAASSAYLTASEIFPLETRAMAIALVLCPRDADRGRHRAFPVRPPDRVRQPVGGRRWLRRCGCPDDCRRGMRGVPRGRGRGQVAGGYCSTAVQQWVTDATQRLRGRVCTCG